MLPFVGVASFVGLIVFIVKAVRATKKKTGTAKRMWLYTVGCFVVFLICFSMDGGAPSASSVPEQGAKQASPPAEKKAVAAEKKAVPINKTVLLKQNITKAVNDQLGSQNSNQKKTVVSVQVDMYSAGGKSVTITLNGDENLTNNLTKKTLQMNSDPVFKSAFKNKEVNCVIVAWQLPLSDAYGKTSDEVVMRIKLTRDTFNKIDWNNFDFENYPTIADDYFEHPALNK